MLCRGIFTNIGQTNFGKACCIECNVDDEGPPKRKVFWKKFFLSFLVVCHSMKIDILMQFESSVKVPANEDLHFSKTKLVFWPRYYCSWETSFWLADNSDSVVNWKCLLKVNDLISSFSWFGTDQWLRLLNLSFG